MCARPLRAIQWEGAVCTVGHASYASLALHCVRDPARVLCVTWDPVPDPSLQAAANKLKRELEEAEAGESAGDAAAAPAAESASATRAASTAGTSAPGVFKAKKSKLVAKGGAAVSTQAEILLKSGVPEDEVPLFAVREPPLTLQMPPSHSLSMLT